MDRTPEPDRSAELADAMQECVLFVYQKALEGDAQARRLIRRVAPHLALGASARQTIEGWPEEPE